MNASQIRILLVVALAWLIPSLAQSDEPRNKLPKKQHRSSNAPFLEPPEAVKKMSIPDGFEVSVFAAEPDIAEPIAFCFDDRGRLWVAENFNYRTRREHTGDKVSRIQILEDTDSDGVAEVYSSVESRFRCTGNYHEFAYGPVINSNGEMFFSTGLSSSGLRSACSRIRSRSSKGAASIAPTSSPNWTTPWPTPSSSPIAETSPGPTTASPPA